MVNTDFHRIKYGFPHYCVYLCHVRVNLCLIILRQFFSGFAAVSKHHLLVMRLFGNFVAVIWRLRRG